jgi:hypothetical protein
MRKALTIFSVLSLALVGGLHEASAASIVTNGDFETGDLSGWTATGNLTGGEGGSYYGVANGIQNGGDFGAYFGLVGSPLTLSQTVAVSDSTSYTVDFSLFQDSFGSPGYTNLFSASFNGVSLLSETNAPNSGGYQEFTYVVTTAAGGNSGVLSFAFQNDDDFFFFDDVSVTTNAVTNPTPEPSSMALFLVGIPAFVGYRFIRRGKLFNSAL